MGMGLEEFKLIKVRFRNSFFKSKVGLKMRLRVCLRVFLLEVFLMKVFSPKVFLQ